MRRSVGPRAIAGNKAAGHSAALMGAAGVVIFFISLAAAFLPRVNIAEGAVVVGVMMLVAGAVEMLSGIVRRANGLSFMLPGAVTIIAGVLFVLKPFDAFTPMVWLMIAWLALRGSVLVLGSFEVRRSIRLWTFASAGTDVALAGILLAGLSASTLPIVLFGPTSDIIHGFAVVVAISFVTTAMLLIEVASFESRLASHATSV